MNKLLEDVITAHREACYSRAKATGYNHPYLWDDYEEAEEAFRAAVGALEKALPVWHEIETAPKED